MTKVEYYFTKTNLILYIYNFYFEIIKILVKNCFNSFYYVF